MEVKASSDSHTVLSSHIVKAWMLLYWHSFFQQGIFLCQEKKRFWNAILVCVLLRKNFWNGVLACSVTKIPLLIATLPLS
jgi:hypothetical protein